ncbi:LacI family DNA-binding transcriptional regulator [Streptomyces sp. ISL-11]|uniref:LacI family DNA-binding transcriptional regulator n=1 Tax=Streptomyces sp. ISL-11 TaxID=2819174 RepID=UPI001BEC5B8F|nr:LacI family DNA-binding transcriptional regulator [Streptomyces sp. ISL-11]MBT2385566.1 LacI family DNA-binding transcriptional regulator [Streptomyces sp. ISL-11]
MSTGSTAPGTGDRPPPRRARRAGATLEEVAARAGVGRGTASRVLNGSPRVSERARAAVERAVTELGYVPHRAARALAAGRADTVALVIPEPGTAFFPEAALAGIVRGVGAELADGDIQLLLVLLRTSEDRRRFADRLAAHPVDGVLVVSAHDDDPLPALLAGTAVPAVVTGGPAPAGGLCLVDTDDTGGARAAVEHLLARGRRTVAALVGPPGSRAAASRLDGYRQALEAAGRAGDEKLVVTVDPADDGAYAATRALLDRRPALDAVFASSDTLAAGALRALRAAGRRVPADVALTGFDDSPVARDLDPPLTSVRRPVEELGRAMARTLLARIGDCGARHARIVLPAELIARASS